MRADATAAEPSRILCQVAAALLAAVALQPASARATQVSYLAISDAEVEEGGPEAVLATFQVFLQPPQPATVTVDFVTADGSAEAGKDYSPVGGTLTFPPGATNAALVVPVLDDGLGEWTETFYVWLSNPSPGTAMADDTGEGRIIDASDPLFDMQGRVLREPPGPCSRRTGLVLSEIMYHPAGVTPEYVELYNSNPWPAEIGGFRLVGEDFEFVFPAHTVLEPGAFLVVADRAMDVHGATMLVWGDLVLDNSGDTLRLFHRQGPLLLEVSFGDEAPWPLQADGWGHSLVLARPSYGEATPQAWAASAWKGGSPGRWDPVISDPIQLVLVNEVLIKDGPDQVELYNPTPFAFALSNLSVGNGLEGVLPGAVMPPGGFFTIPYAQVEISTADGRSVIAVLADVPEVASWGRFPDGAEGFQVLARRTPGISNAPPTPSAIVIDEIMYDPISGDPNDQYVELHNQTPWPVDIGGWSLEGDVRFEFGLPTFVPPYAYLVVAKSRQALWANYPHLNETNTLGNFSGSLNSEGGTVILEIQRSGPDIRVAVPYGGGAGSRFWCRGGGSSLELVDLRADPRQAWHWADSEESGKSDWVQIEMVGNPGQALGAHTNDFLQLLLLGVGECLLDDLEVRSGAGPNLLPNPGFEDGLAGWVPSGSHDQSSLESEGYNGSQSLHLRASAPGEPVANHVRSAPLAAPATGTVTLRARARWLRGSPDLVLRLHGGGLEAASRLPPPSNPGTPGLPNSRALTNSGPAIVEVRHFPILPRAGEPARLTARLADPDGVGWAFLHWRLGSGSALNHLQMVDDGTRGDLWAGDGTYTAILPGQAAGAVVSFHIEAEDTPSALPPARSLFPQEVFPRGSARTFPSDAPTRECVIRWEETELGGFASYRLWITPETEARWSQRPALDDAPLEGTFVCNNCRVIYNAAPRYHGSPWTLSGTVHPRSPTLVDYRVGLPEPFLGADEILLATPGQAGGPAVSDPSGLIGRTAAHLLAEMDLPWSYARYVHVFLNGSRRTGDFVMEDVQDVEADYLQTRFPSDHGGDLFRVHGWFEFDAGSGRLEYGGADLVRRTAMVTGQAELNSAPYRFMWQKENPWPGGEAGDYTALSRLIDAISPVSNPGSDQIENEPLLEVMADMNQWLRLTAVQHVIGNCDSYGYRRPATGFAFRTASGGFIQLPGKISAGFGLSGGTSATADPFECHDPRLAAVLRTPRYRRLYLQHLAELVSGPFSNERLDPWLDRWAASLQSSQIAVEEAVARMKDYVAERRAALLPQLAGPPFQLSTPSQLATTNNFVVLSGTAPLEVAAIAVSGNLQQVTWTSPTRWSVLVLLGSSENFLTVAAHDRVGQVLDSLPVFVARTGPLVEPLDRIVFSEIKPGDSSQAGFVELYNASSFYAFDLSSWQLPELGYAFPNHTLLLPGAYLVLASDRLQFAGSYGASVPVAGQYQGNLSLDGGTLTLLRSTRPLALVVNELTVNSPPPQVDFIELYNAGLEDLDISGFGLSDDFRFSKFTFPSVTVIPARGFFALDEFILDFGLRGSGEQIYLRAADGSLLDCLQYADAATNGLVLGRFPDGSPDVYELTQSTPAQANTAVLQPEPQSACFTPTDAPLVPVLRIRYETVPPWPAASGLAGASLELLDPNQDNARVSNWSAGNSAPRDPTPGRPNADAALLPPYPRLWLNELQVSGGIVDHAGEADPWVELYHAAAEPLSLEGYYLTDNYQDPTRWAFPVGTAIGPGQFMIVWLDGQEGQSTGDQLHANFRLAGGSGSVALAREVGGHSQLLDYLNYSGLGSGLSYGSLPDGQVVDRYILAAATPAARNQSGQTNGPSLPPVRVNEWMARNNQTIIDPADGDAEDWFELYNAGSIPVRLDGYFLSDSPSAPREWRIPDGAALPAFGFLLVWADGETNQNRPPLASLHASFGLGGSGDEIILSAPDGRVVDLVRFGAQERDISEGRYFDGGPRVFRMLNPTPARANFIPNTPPVLAAIPDQAGRVGEGLSVQVVATDMEAPPQSLTYSLPLGGPAGAQIDPATGLFRWTPSPAHAQTTNRITVRVSDNGTPTLRGEGSFAIVVLVQPPTVEPVSLLANGWISFRWQTFPGRIYRVEYNDQLGVGNWMPAETARPGTGGFLSFTADSRAARQRFFRVLEAGE